jgi:hypothetical protein
LELRILSQEIQDGLGARDAVEMSGRCVADGQDALDDERVEARGRLGAGTRAAVQDGVIVGRGGAKALSPFLDPSEGAVGGSGILLKGPGRVKAKQGAEQCPVGEPAVFHRVTSV